MHLLFTICNRCGGVSLYLTVSFPSYSLSDDFHISSLPGPSAYPLNFTGRAISSRSITFQWVEITLNEQNSPSVSYIIVCLSCKGVDEKNLYSVPPRFPTTINGLSPYKEYEFSISTENVVGFGPSSGVISIRTQEDSK